MSRGGQGVGRFDLGQDRQLPHPDQGGQEEERRKHRPEENPGRARSRRQLRAAVEGVQSSDDGAFLLGRDAAPCPLVPLQISCHGG
jgi:hypothetical protein